MLSRHRYSEINNTVMNNRYLVTIFIIVFSNQQFIFPQISDKQLSLSFDQAVSYALQNNPEYKIKNLDYLIAQEQLKETQLQRVPQIYSRYDIQRNLIIPSTLVPIGQFNPDLPSDELTPIKFGTNWSSGIGLYGSFIIFDPEVSGKIKEQRASVELIDVERKISEAELINAAGMAYTDCLLAREQVMFAEEDTINSNRFLAESYLQYEAGMIKQTDLNQAIFNHSGALSRYNEAVRILSASYKTLLYWMGYTEQEYTELLLTDSPGILMKRLDSLEYESVEPSHSLTHLRYNAINNIDKIRLKNVKAGFLPVISLNGILVSDYYSNQFNPGNKNLWFGNSNINVSVQIPITEGISRTRKIAQQNYQLEANLEEFNAALNKKELDIRRVSDNISFYKKEMNLQESNLELAQENLNSSFSLFEQGRILPSDLNNAEISYKQIKIEYLKAIYNYINALLEKKMIMES